MKTRFGGCAFLLALLLVVPQPARAALASRYVFPSVANAVGLNGAEFRTAIRIYSPYNLSMTLLMRLATPDGPSQTREVLLAAGSVYSSDNVLEEVFEYEGGAALEITESTASLPFAVTAYVYTDGPTGRVSTPLRSLPTADRLPEFPGWALVLGLSSDAQHRASFGCVNLDRTPAKVLVNALSTGTGFGDPQIVFLDLPPGSWQQVPISVQGETLILAFQASTDVGPQGTYCYGVTTSNSLNDGLSVPAEPIPLPR